MSAVRFLGLDVHASKIAVAVAEPNGEARNWGFPKPLGSDSEVHREVRSCEELRACYEAGPPAYVLSWQLTALGVLCEVIALAGSGQSWGQV